MSEQHVGRYIDVIERIWLSLDWQAKVGSAGVEVAAATSTLAGEAGQSAALAGGAWNGPLRTRVGLGALALNWQRKFCAMSKEAGDRTGCEGGEEEQRNLSGGGGAALVAVSREPL